MTKHNHQLIAGTYTVFETAQQCRDAFERAKQLGINTYREYWQHETILEVSYNSNVMAMFTPFCDKQIPPAEFLARMDGTWGQSAENAQNNPSITDNSQRPIIRPEDTHGYHEVVEAIKDQLIGNSEQLTLPQAIAKLEAEGWYLNAAMQFCRRDNNYCIMAAFGSSVYAIYHEGHIYPKEFPTAAKELQQAIDACTLLNNAKPE